MDIVGPVFPMLWYDLDSLFRILAKLFKNLYFSNKYANECALLSIYLYTGIFTTTVQHKTFFLGRVLTNN